MTSWAAITFTVPSVGAAIAPDSLGLGAGGKYVDQRAGQTANTAFSMDAYTVVDLLGYYKVNERVRLNLDVKNLFNREYEEGAFGNIYAYPGAPRTVQVGIAYTL